MVIPPHRKRCRKSGYLTRYVLGVLVHCYAGSSRSVACVIAYLLKKKIINSVDDGLDLIVSKGGSPNPNEGFLEQLGKFTKT